MSTQTPQKGDTLNVTKYSVRNEVSDALKNWKSFVFYDATIFAPSDWKKYIADGVSIVVPPNNEHGNEGIRFDKYKQDVSNPDYDKIVRILYHKAFTSYKITEEDKLKKMELNMGTIYEKNIKLEKDKNSYKGYFLIYKNQTYIYEYTMIFAQKRLSNYNGSLMQDIAGNLSVSGVDIIGGSNAIRKIIILE